MPRRRHRAISGRSSEALRPPPLQDRVAGWLWPLAITVLAGFLRFYRISLPPAIVNGKPSYTFDEVYYTVDAHSLLQFGVERGDHCVGPGLAVHPPLGKWMMAIGEWMFGYVDCAGHPHGNPALGWRFSAAVFGTLAVLILARTARRMFRSTLIGCLAGLLMALDGLELVQSRTGLLDIFLMFWIVAGPRRHRPRPRLGTRDGSPTRLAVGFWRPWRLTAGHLLRRRAIATKWTGFYVLIPLSAVVLAWDIGARRSSGAPPGPPGQLRRDGGGWATNFIVVPIVVYTASFTGWFVTHYGYMRNDYGKGVYNTWRAWWHWHQVGATTSTSTSTPGIPTSPTARSSGWCRAARRSSRTPRHRTAPHCSALNGCSQTVLDLGSPADLVAGDPRASSAASGCGSAAATGAPR